MVFALLVMFHIPVTADDGVTIQFHYRDTPGAQDVVSAWIDAFQEIHPEIRVEWIPATGVRTAWQDRL